jgi:hypothetical protein
MDEYEKISWAEMRTDEYKGKEFYIRGKSGGNVFYYGPYKIFDGYMREMTNVNGKRFIHHSEDFYIKKG